MGEFSSEFLVETTRVKSRRRVLRWVLWAHVYLFIANTSQEKLVVVMYSRHWRLFREVGFWMWYCGLSMEIRI